MHCLAIANSTSHNLVIYSLSIYHTQFTLVYFYADISFELLQFFHPLASVPSWYVYCHILSQSSFAILNEQSSFILPFWGCVRFLLSILVVVLCASYIYLHWTWVNKIQWGWAHSDTWLLHQQWTCFSWYQFASQLSFHICIKLETYWTLCDWILDPVPSFR